MVWGKRKKKNKKAKKEERKQKRTWVTSAEVTHITTTAPIKNKPALYLQLIMNQTRPTMRNWRNNLRSRWVPSDLSQKIFHCSDAGDFLGMGSWEFLRINIQHTNREKNAKRLKNKEREEIQIGLKLRFGGYQLISLSLFPISLSLPLPPMTFKFLIRWE